MNSTSGAGCRRLVRQASRPKSTSVQQAQRQVALDQHADHAERVAAQRERILVAGGQLADAEQADQRLQLVGQCDDDAGRAARQRVAGEARLVVVLDRDRRRRRARRRGARSSRPSRLAARGTRRPCRSAGRPWPAAPHGLPVPRAAGCRAVHRSPARWRARARRARPASRACRGRPPWPVPATRDSSELLAVLVEEELRVGQPRPHDALVAFDDARWRRRDGCC